jgi:hypothetical protein
VIKKNAFAGFSVFGGDMTKEFKKSLHDVKLVLKTGRSKSLTSKSRTGRGTQHHFV